MNFSIRLVVCAVFGSLAAPPLGAAPASLMVEAEDFDGVEQFPIWQTDRGRWYAKEHLAAYARGGAYAIANEFSIGATMHTTLDRELPAGKYNVWLRVVIWMDSDESVEVELNGTKQIYSWTIKTKRRGYRWLPGTITTTKAGRALSVKALKANQQNFGESPRPPCKFLVLDSIYIAPGTEEIQLSSTNKDDTLFVERDSEPEPITEVAAAVQTTPEGNLIENSGFEVGASRGWGSLSKLDVLGDAYLNSSDAAGGTASLSSKHSENETVLTQIASRPYRLTEKGPYTLSGYVKGEAGSVMSLMLHNLKRKPVMAKRIALTPEWKRASVTATLSPGEYYVVASGAYQLDNVQLEKGAEASAYKPVAPVEVALISNVPGRIYFPDDELDPTLRVYAAPDHDVDSITVRCNVYNIWNSVVLSREFNLKCGPGQTLNTPADIIPDRFGTFRAEVEVAGIQRTKAEFVFSVAPRPRTMGIERDSWLGIMPESKDYVLASLQRAGFKWMQNIRDAAVSRWCYAEPKQGEIKWYDELVGRSRKYGIEPVILLHVNYNRLPAWVKPTAQNKNVPQDIDLWKSFVRRMVEHYKDKAKFWQFSDDIHHFFSEEEHAMLLKAAYEAAKSADPECVFIGWRFFNREVPGWEEAMKKTEPYSDIIYAADKVVREMYGKETHSYLFGSSTTMYNFAAHGDEARIQNLERERRQSSLGRTMGFCRYAENVGKVEALFYYMAYLGTPPFQTRQSKQAFEHCGALNVGTLSARLLDHFLFKMECLGNVSRSRSVSAYHFRKDSESCMVAWSSAGQELTVRLDSADDLKFYAAMGNAFEPGKDGQRIVLPLYDTPVFVVGKNIAADSMKTVFATAEVRFPIEVRNTLVARNGRVDFDVQVTNNTEKATDIDVVIAATRYSPLRWGGASKHSIQALTPGKKSGVSFPLKYGLHRHAEYKALNVTVAAGETSFTRRTMLWLMSSKRAQNAIELDGNLNEWGDAAPIRLETTHVSGATRRMKQVRLGAITGDEELTQGRQPIIKGRSDISGLIYSRWTDSHIHFAARILDDSVEAGDRIELFFDTNLQADRADEQLSDDDLVFRFDVGGSAGHLQRNDKVTPVPATSKNTDDGYGVEISIPWKELPVKPAAGSLIGFDVAVTDVDKKTMHAQMVWAGAAAGWGDPTGYGNLVLSD